MSLAAALGRNITNRKMLYRIILKLNPIQQSEPVVRIIDKKRTKKKINCDHVYFRIFYHFSQVRVSYKHRYLILSTLHRLQD